VYILANVCFCIRVQTCEQIVEKVEKYFHSLTHACNVTGKAQQARQGGGKEFLEKVVTAARKSIALRRRACIRVAVCCIVLQYVVAVCCGVVQCGAVCCSVLQCGVVCCNVL